MRNSPSYTRVLSTFFALALVQLSGQAPAAPPQGRDAQPVQLSPAQPPPVRETDLEKAALPEVSGVEQRPGDPEAAIVSLARAVAKRPEEVRYPLELARALLAAERPRQAEAVLNRALPRFPNHAGLRLAWIDAALAQRRYATALERVRTATARQVERPALQFRAAQGYFHLGQVLGAAEVRAVPGGRAGQFVGKRLLVEARLRPDHFLCCPPRSAYYQLRQALDAGLDEPAAHVLHARIWQRLGRPQIGLAVLKSRAVVLLAQPDESVLAAFSELACETGALSDYLRFERMRADRQPESRLEILFAAYLTVAESYNQRGEEILYIHWLQRAARLRPDDLGVILRLADAEWAAGQPARAAPWYCRLLRLEPDHPERGRIAARLAETAGANP